MDMIKMMKQAASLQKDLKKKQKQLAGQTVEFASADGSVSMTISCDMKPKSIVISPELIQSGDVKKIESAVLDAVKGAVNRAQDEAAKEMKSLTAGMNLPF
ncbi:MAG: YbaB/EbfC family nucleoid-associated protein [Verrucomicrobia bacterium]|nr:YbaB/EbfC family nucleoid-associated protein [Verrucomicrobiota bacterium]